MPSKAKTLDRKDYDKIAKAFLYNAGSLIMAVLIAIMALEPGELPSSLYWIIPLAPVLNAVVYGWQRWKKDNSLTK